MRPAVHPSVQTSWPTLGPWHSLMPVQDPPLKASMVGSLAVSTNAATHLQQIYTAWVMTCTLSVPTFLCLDRLREQRICAHVQALSHVQCCASRRPMLSLPPSRAASAAHMWCLTAAAAIEGYSRGGKAHLVICAPSLMTATVDTERHSHNNVK